MICNSEKEILQEIKKKKKEIEAYGDVEISDKTVKKITKKGINIIGYVREE